MIWKEFGYFEIILYPEKGEKLHGKNSFKATQSVLGHYNLRLYRGPTTEPALCILHPGPIATAV